MAKRKGVTPFNRSHGWDRKARTPYVNADAYHWHRRILNEQKQSPRVQELVLSGKADRWLKVA